MLIQKTLNNVNLCNLNVKSALVNVEIDIAIACSPKINFVLRFV